jgi:hypothetical protein
MFPVAGDALPIAAGAFQHVSNILAIRALPFAVYAALTGMLTLPRRLLVMGAYLAGILLLPVEVAKILGPTLIGSAYYLAVACSVPLCTRALRAGFLTRGALFVLFAVAYLLFPAVLMHEMAGIFLILGWDLLLSTYSYCLDVSSSRQTPTMGDCLFFLLVNPTLTYSNRGLREGAPNLEWRAAVRVVLGLSTMFVCSALLRPIYRDISTSTDPLESRAAVLTFLLMAGGLRFLIEYAVHSGLASIQIGFMRLIGYTIPERYNYPLLATSPLDFWRRWNTYVSGWLGKYVFLPLTRRFQHRFSHFSKAAALLLTFLASGLLHEVYSYSANLKGTTTRLQLFAASGFIVLLWLGIEQRHVATKLAKYVSYRAVATLAPRLAIWLLLILAAIAWG